METDQIIGGEFESSGRVWLRKAISEGDLSLFDKAISNAAKAGQRLPATEPLKDALSCEGSLLSAVRRLLPQAIPVRVVSFNKSKDTNWGVPWRQDRVIAVADKSEVDGYKNWKNKSGTWHCEPPQTILNDMLFVRVHLDDSDQSNGAMEIAVGSHSEGLVPSMHAEEVANRYPIEPCVAQRGDVLILKMLTLHRSKPAQHETSRRVLRIDFSSSHLPLPLSWEGYPVAI